ncbi:hypothetical protein ACQEVC_45590 [Plantactinospora sp. CA-294935]|uniref:hypothetical protein n=1 Tax=Plantactinospora sp. CA-294935 TaxID=3240012 RepID=UPI003D8E26B7
MTTLVTALLRANGPYPARFIDRSEIEMTPMPDEATCTEDGCPTTVADTPGSRCGELNGEQTAAGCGELFCNDHLFATQRDGYLCAADYRELVA